jgi:hypothetical protein
MARRMKFEDRVPLMIAWIRNGDDFERKVATDDLMDIARLADRFVKNCDEAAEAKALPFTEEMMRRLTEK